MVCTLFENYISAIVSAIPFDILFRPAKTSKQRGKQDGKNYYGRPGLKCCTKTMYCHAGAGAKKRLSGNAVPEKYTLKHAAKVKYANAI
jgi:hypothetical protein